MEEKISVILVNYNGIDYNDNCIESILKSTIKEKIQIVVVDNDSTDDSLKTLHYHWDYNDQVHIIELGENCGFSVANNEGINWSINNGINYFLLLNNDTEIQSDAIEKMLMCHKEKGGIVVPKILYADKKDVIWCAGGELSKVIKKPKHRGIDCKDIGQFDVNEKCSFANGCCMLLTKEIIEKNGLLDDRFFLYYEDTEYSMRAATNGVDIYYCSTAKVYHKVNGSTKGNENPANAYYVARNWLLCNSLHLEMWRFVLFCVYFTINRLVWIMLWSLKGKWNMDRATFLGIVDFFKNKWGRWNA